MKVHAQSLFGEKDKYVIVIDPGHGGENTGTVANPDFEEKDIQDILVISPDMGAMERARYYAEIIGCDVGVFYKRRDPSKIVNGKTKSNPQE